MAIERISYFCGRIATPDETSPLYLIFFFLPFGR
jgi:hypothetical protein